MREHIKNKAMLVDYLKMRICFIVASRRSSEELIFQGRVTVNGSVCKTPQVKFRNAPILQKCWVLKPVHFYFWFE